jgi:hypothetical protein
LLKLQQGCSRAAPGAAGTLAACVGAGLAIASPRLLNQFLL